ncbi:substrate-binding domain-containing protein [Streptomyces noursei]|uniref:substrate-binding domain-containing protein n=1 Tax=Streptomyces noursei TaxID=1971 RepID=UPI00340B560F
MGRHSLPDDSAPQGTGSPRTRRRTVVLATAVLVIAATGSVVALRGGLLPFGTSCDGDSVRLEVIASPDIAPALNAVADKAREDAVRTDGRCLDVKIDARPSAEVADSLGQRPANPDFQVWVPDSDLWVHQVTDNRGSTLTAVGAVASSPLALGAVHDAAKTLGWPAKTYSWTALTRAASGGALRLGVADPARSATGLLALARIDAADRKGAGSGDVAATRTAATAKLLHERVADGDDQVLATLPRNDLGAEQGNPRRNQALLLSEQAAYAHNTSGDAGPALDLFYPTDGTAQLTYPYTLVDEDSLTADQNRAANRFMTLLDDTSGQQTLRDHGFRAGNGSADPPLTGKAGGRAPQPFAGAPTDPPTSKELQALLGMWSLTVQSARTTTAVDASPSMALAGR